MHFPVSGVDCPLVLPPLVAFVLASLTASSGLSGAFLLLPFQMSVLGFVSPAVTPTNLIYNVVAIPGGIYRYMREGRMAWPLTWVVILGTLPGVFLGAVVRLRYLPDPRAMKVFVGCVLMYLAVRLLRDFFRPAGHRSGSALALERKFQAQQSGNARAAGLPPGAVIRTTRVSLRRIEYEFWNESFGFNPIAIFGLALIVGIIGGIYGIGGGAIIAPFVVAIFGLPVYTVAGAAMLGTFLTSIAGVGCFQVLGVRADWQLGALFGIGGLVGTYVGARLQKYFPERWIRLVLGLLVGGLGISYVAGAGLRLIG